VVGARSFTVDPRKAFEQILSRQTFERSAVVDDGSRARAAARRESMRIEKYIRDVVALAVGTIALPSEDSVMDYPEKGMKKVRDVEKRLQRAEKLAVEILRLVQV